MDVEARLSDRGLLTMTIAGKELTCDPIEAHDNLEIIDKVQEANPDRPRHAFLRDVASYMASLGAEGATMFEAEAFYMLIVQVFIALKKKRDETVRRLAESLSITE